MAELPTFDRVGRRSICQCDERQWRPVAFAVAVSRAREQRSDDGDHHGKLQADKPFELIIQPLAYEDWQSAKFLAELVELGVETLKVRFDTEKPRVDAL